MSIHELPRNIAINNFYARLLGHYKDYLDACFEGSFTSKEVEAKWDLLETIQSNTKIGIVTKVKNLYYWFSVGEATLPLHHLNPQFTLSKKTERK
jgi:hypothetical protein